jgi:Ca2+-binding RTX toxin-like protein
LIGGSGNDDLAAGNGADTLTGGSGSNEFVFYQPVINGSAPHDTITDFNASDVAYLVGYSSNEASQDLVSAVSSGGNTTLTLSDNTQITFLDVSSASALRGHVVSF